MKQSTKSAINMETGMNQPPSRTGVIGGASLRARAVAVLASVCGLLFAAAPAAAQIGVTDGSFFAKTHSPLGLSGLSGTGNLALGFAGQSKTEAQWRQALIDLPEQLQAGGHPDATTGFFIDDHGSLPGGLVRDIVVDTPPGFVGNPQVAPTCTMQDFFSAPVNDVAGRCREESQIGIATKISSGFIEFLSPVYNLKPPPNAPAAFGTWTSSPHVPTVLIPRVRSNGDYGLEVTASQIASFANFQGATVTVWGVPHDPIHDKHRWNTATQSWGASVTGVRPRPFLIAPTDCDAGTLTTHIRARSWNDPNFWDSESDPAAGPVEGCERLSFDATMEAQPASSAPDSPSGWTFRLRVPYNDDAEGLARPTLRNTVLRLPEGVAISPSAADGLEACTPEQIGLDSREAPSCPEASTLAEVDVVTPLLPNRLRGSMFQAAQGDNPFGSTFAVYLYLEGSGVRVKLAGLVETDPVTGRVTTRFTDSPQLPFSELTVKLKGGSRAPLVLPRLCGTYETVVTLTPWSHPYSGPAALRTENLDVKAGAGRPCPANLAARPLTLDFQGGTVNAAAGAESSFAMRLLRRDGDQEFDRIDVKTPPGLSASLRGIPYCSEAGIAQAVARDGAGDGRLEMSSPSCPIASRIGGTTVGAGAGPHPFFVRGDAYLAGPYKGAPLSAVFVVPAVAGPFDLGVQVVRVALHVDRRTAQVTANSDAIPKILEGVPLRIKDIRVNMDRPGFTRNPTSCAEKTLSSTVFGADSGRADVSSRFQVGDCQGLPFKPRLSLALVGKNQRTTGKHPGINATVKQTGVGEAGIKKAVVRLPKSLALDVNNAQALCEFEDGTKPDLENHCPAGSIIGRARATTPLLDDDLAGNVYFVKNIRRDPKTGNLIRTLPMLVVALRGQVSINLVGESDTQNGRLVNTFNGVPDAPVNQFNMNINGGSNGIIAVTRTRAANINLCARPNSHIADADMDGQNGRRYDRDIRMKTPCTKRQIKAAKRAAKKAAKKQGTARR